MYGYEGASSKKGNNIVDASGEGRYRHPWRVLLVLKSYLDGSHGSQIVTLGSIAIEMTALEFSANKAAFEDFERDWQVIISANEGRPIHAAELMYKDFGGKGAAILQRCVDVLARLDQEIFHTFVCTIDLIDYERARIECPYLMTPRLDENRPKPAEAVCVDWCAGSLFDRLNIDTERPAETGGIDLIFDQNEDFLCEIHRVHTADKKRRPLWADERKAMRTFSGYIRSTKCISSSLEWPLQAADVIAWSTNRHYTVGDRNSWFDALRQRRVEDFRFYDYETIIRKYKDR
jgi:Protein of unknown function (DUF3800)